MGREIAHLRSEIDALFRNSLLEEWAPPISRLWAEGVSFGGYQAPPVDVVETKDALVVKLDLPGVRKEDIVLEVNERGVLIKAERTKELEESQKGWYRFERNYQGFHRYLSLPVAVVGSKGVAHYADGVLEIRFPKGEPVPTTRLLVD